MQSIVDTAAFTYFCLFEVLMYSSRLQAERARLLYVLLCRA